jgi:hypothetical protein
MAILSIHMNGKLARNVMLNPGYKFALPSARIRVVRQVVTTQHGRVKMSDIWEPMGASIVPEVEQLNVSSGIILAHTTGPISSVITQIQQTMPRCAGVAMQLSMGPLLSAFPAFAVRNFIQ